MNKLDLIGVLKVGGKEEELNRFKILSASY